jgi:hypothetical protein
MSVSLISFPTNFVTVLRCKLKKVTKEIIRAVLASSGLPSEPVPQKKTHANVLGQSFLWNAPHAILLDVLYVKAHDMAVSRVRTVGIIMPVVTIAGYASLGFKLQAFHKKF